MELYLPLIVPAGFGFIGSFGGITRFKGFVPDRETLLNVSVSGPAVGTIASSVAVLAGFILTSLGLGDVSIDSPAFADSLIMALGGQLFLGDALTHPEVQVSSLLLAGWAGLAVNALNMLPTGELDGGRISLALLGRRWVAGGGGRLATCIHNLALHHGSAWYCTIVLHHAASQSAWSWYRTALTVAWSACRPDSAEGGQRCTLLHIGAF